MTSQLRGRSAVDDLRWSRLRPALLETWALVLRSDLALAYAGALVVVYVLVHWRSDPASHHLVVQSSTNLANLRDHPPYVLFVSAFVLDDPSELLLLPVVVLVYALAQAWLGRAATVVAAVLGHVGTTLWVAVLLTAGIFHRRISASVSFVSDVGISYGLACLTGLLVARVARRWRAWYVCAVVVAFCLPLLLAMLGTGRPSFTQVGHASALLIGLGLAVLVSRARAASTRA